LLVVQTTEQHHLATVVAVAVQRRLVATAVLLQAVQVEQRNRSILLLPVRRYLRAVAVEVLEVQQAVLAVAALVAQGIAVHQVQEQQQQPTQVAAVAVQAITAQHNEQAATAVQASFT
jgi:hypothetical protein